MIRDINELNTRVTFYKFSPNDGPEPGEEEMQVLHSCWASVEKVRARDLEQAKANDTLEDVTIIIRDSRMDYVPRNSHYVGIDDGRYFGKRYNIKTYQPDLKDKRFMTIIAEMSE